LLFVGTYNKPHGSLYALNSSTSAVVWQFEARGAIGSTPCFIADTDLVVFGADDGSVYAVDGTTGKQVWRFRHELLARFSISSSPVYIASASASVGTIFIGTSDRSGHILALRVSGRSAPTLVWSRATGSGAAGAGVPGACAVYDGTVFIGANDGNIYALNAGDGATKWSAATRVGTVNCFPTAVVQYEPSTDNRTRRCG
jgi:outer membrane protein assembly factor BamB